MCKYKYNIFPVTVAKPTGTLYGRSVESTAVGSVVTFINSFLKAL
jgi:hypothetical protein